MSIRDDSLQGLTNDSISLQQEFIDLMEKYKDKPILMPGLNTLQVIVALYHWSDVNNTAFQSLNKLDALAKEIATEALDVMINNK